jgi:hypothetical protein
MKKGNLIERKVKEMRARQWRVDVKEGGGHAREKEEKETMERRKKKVRSKHPSPKAQLGDPR